MVFQLLIWDLYRVQPSTEGSMICQANGKGPILSQGKDGEGPLPVTEVFSVTSGELHQLR